MTAGLFIRKGQIKDVDAVSALLIKTWHEAHENAFDADKIDEINQRWHAPAVIADKIDLPDHCFLVAETGGEICGYCEANLDSNGQIWLSKIYVLSGSQGSGVGAKLLNAVIAEFPGATAIRLEVGVKNSKAQHFYKKHGFITVGQSQCCGGDSDLPSLIMEKQL